MKILRLKRSSMTPRAVPTTIVLATLALLAAGCGASSRTNTSTDSKATVQNFATAGFRFANCMRHNGAPSFPDPTVTNNGTGGQAVRQVVPASVGKSPQFRAAQKACGGILPGPSPQDLAAQAQQQRVHTQDLLGFARCLRSHGFGNFPDPDAQGRLSGQTVVAAGIDVHSPGFLSTAKACLPAANGGISAAELQQAENSVP
jgi:hypothetical protein